jgi:hypothetical protein
MSHFLRTELCPPSHKGTIRESVSLDGPTDRETDSNRIDHAHPADTCRPAVALDRRADAPAIDRTADRGGRCWRFRTGRVAGHTAGAAAMPAPGPFRVARSTGRPTSGLDSDDLSGLWRVRRVPTDGRTATSERWRAVIARPATGRHGSVDRTASGGGRACGVFQLSRQQKTCCKKRN